MGAIGASLLGTHNADRFDAIASLGGPFDAAYFARYVDRYHLGGFCTREELEALVAQHPGDPDVLNDPKRLTCMKRVQGVVPFEHSQSMMHWRFTDNGGTFDRSMYLRAFRDLALGFGNPLYYNPDSPFAPGGTARDTTPKGLDPDKLKNPPADICRNPLRIQKLYNAEYNPDGRYDAITFCDGEESPIYYCIKTGEPVDFCSGGPKVVPKSQERAFAAAFCGDNLLDEATRDRRRDLYFQEKGRYDPCREHTELMSVLVAFDYNGNGRRDYGEPIVNNGFERFDDVGRDGCPSPLEDGRGGCVADAAQSPFAQGNKDPNGDDYDALANFAGTENNWLREDGEPFRDFGLDGVADTGDFGEGNGSYDLSPNRQRMLALDPRGSYNRLAEKKKRELDLLVDGGIRDVFNFGVMGRELFGSVRGFSPADALYIRDFKELPGRTSWDDREFNGLEVKWGTVPRNLLLLYGNEQPAPDELDAGDGDHVGTPFQAVQRFFVMSSWLSSRWKGADVPTGEVSDISSRLFTRTYYSKALGAERDYGLYLPPGYDDPANKDARYPVLFMLHGYGMKAAGRDGFHISSAVIFEVPMQDLEFPMRKMIVVFVSGRCCFTHKVTGARVCTEEDPQGRSWDATPDYVRECASGNFYLDAAGYKPGAGLPYEQSFLELMDHIDATTRTLPPA
ncbi:MAG: hypothetical protein ACK4N5_12085, partial [Myxococcales bacterium]